MSSRRTLILVGAIVVGAIAALLILRYVGSVKDKASSENHLVPVVVATGDIPKDTAANDAIAQGLIEIRNRRQADVPANVVTRVENIKSYTATIDISNGSMITSPMFAAATGSSSSDSNQIDPGNVAVTISVDPLHAVAGLVQPGDYVNVLVDTANPADPSIIGTSTVFQKAKILAIGTSLGSQVAAPADGATTATTAPPAASNLVTFEVPPAAAQVIATTSQKSLRLVLVRPDYQPHPIPPYSFNPNSPALPGDSGHTPYEAQPATAAPTLTAGK